MSATWQAYPESGKAGKPHRLFKLAIQNFIILLYNLPMMIDKYTWIFFNVQGRA